MFPGNDIVSSLIAVQMGGTGGGTIAVPDIINYFLGKAPEDEITLIPGYTVKLWSVPDGLFYTWDIGMSYATDTTDNTSHAYLGNKLKNHYIMLGVFKSDTLLYMFPHRLARRNAENYTLIAPVAENPDVITYKSSEGEYTLDGYHITWQSISRNYVDINVSTDFTIIEKYYDRNGNITDNSTYSHRNITERSFPLYCYYPYNVSSGNVPVQWFTNLSQDNLINEMFLFGKELLKAYSEGYKPN